MAKSKKSVSMGDVFKRIYTPVLLEKLRHERTLFRHLDTRTEEQIAADTASYQAELEIDKKRLELAVAYIEAQTDPVIKAILLLHAPHKNYTQDTCEGCDMDGYEAEAPPFPCRTWMLIETMQKEQNQDG